MLQRRNGLFRGTTLLAGGFPRPLIMRNNGRVRRLSPVRSGASGSRRSRRISTLRGSLG